MDIRKLTKRQNEIVNLIKNGYCLPREIAHELKANKTNVSTALKHLLDNGFVVRKRFYGTYVYAISHSALTEQIKQKEIAYSKQMKMEREMFNRRRLMNKKFGYL
jgi:predicted transcriptional regulator